MARRIKTVTIRLTQKDFDDATRLSLALGMTKSSFFELLIRDTKLMRQQARLGLKKMLNDLE